MSESFKQANYIAAVNSDVSPVGDTNSETLVRDVWDIAITRYGSFPIFTRRYDFHGLENFAFDLLLGKPCLIVAHHEFFQNECQGVMGLIEELSSLHAELKWRPLGEVIRRSCNRRISPDGVEECFMYSNELRFKNENLESTRFRFLKYEYDPSSILKIELSNREISWKNRTGMIEYSTEMNGGEEVLIKVLYKDYRKLKKWTHPLKYQLHVAARRFLSELRDEAIYVKDSLKKRFKRPRRANRHI